MTKAQAISAMQEGKRVCHRYFSPGEWITMEGGKIVEENGYRYDPNEFWKYRTADFWQVDWKIFEEEK